MKINFSLKQSWMALVIFAATAPVIIIMVWYAQKLYSDQLANYLQNSRQENELLSLTITGELTRLKTLLHYEAETVELLIPKASAQASIKKMNAILTLLKYREPTITGVFIISKKDGLISAVDPSMDIESQTILAKDRLQQIAKYHQWEKKDFNVSMELIRPLAGKDYISDPIFHDQSGAHGFEINFYISVPIGKPALGILVCEFNINSLWENRLDNVTNYDRKDPLIVDYILGRHGKLITKIEGTTYNLGMEMSGLSEATITHKKKHKHGNWSSDDVYTGILDQPVFSTITKVPLLNWTLVSEVLVSTVTKPIKVGLINITLSTIVGISFFIWLILILAQKTIAPIQNVCKALEEVSRSEFNYNLKKSGIRELDILATGFNAMALKRRQDEQYQKNIVDELEHKNSELERFTYTVSHDLKSPLVTISGFIGLLKADVKNQDSVRIENDLTVIQRAVDDMQTLLNDLLALSRIGRQVTPHIFVDLNNLVKNVLDLLNSQIKQSNANITIDNTLPTVKVEEPRFKEVFLNLIENAIKYRDSDRNLKINIGLTVDSSNTEYTLYVKDNGIGVDPRYKEKVFELFERLNTGSEGSGIGLAIVKRIIEVHHGKIQLDSGVHDEGTKITFTIPKNE